MHVGLTLLASGGLHHLQVCFLGKTHLLGAEASVIKLENKPRVVELLSGVCELKELADTKNSHPGKPKAPEDSCICILRGLGRACLGAGGGNAGAGSMHDQFQVHVNCASTLLGFHLSHSQPVCWGHIGRSLPPHWDKRRCCLNQLYREDCRGNVNPLKSGWCLGSP